MDGKAAHLSTHHSPSTRQTRQMSYNLRKDDLVQVISGNNRWTMEKSPESEGGTRKVRKPKRGRILEIDYKNETVVVEGVNFRKHHEKVRQGKDGRSGGIDEREAPIHISNVAIVDPVTNKPVRVGTRLEDGKRVRVTKGKNASGSVLG